MRVDGLESLTEYYVERRFVRGPGQAGPGQFTLLRVEPRTGRKHQIRIHLAHIGHPIVGDKLYGEDEDLYLALVEGRLTDLQRARLILPCHALHARSVSYERSGSVMRWQCQPEGWFAEFLD